MRNIMTAITTMSILAAVTAPAFALKTPITATKAPVIASAKTKNVKGVKASRKLSCKNKGNIVSLKKTK